MCIRDRDNDDVQLISPERRMLTCVASNVVGSATLTVRGVPRSSEKITTDSVSDKAAPRYTHIDGDVAEASAVNVQRNRLSAELNSTGSPVDACSALFSENESDSSAQSDEPCGGGGDERLRASLQLQRDGIASSDDVRQFRVVHVVTAVLLTVLLTAAPVIAVVAVCLHHHAPRPTGAATPQRSQPAADSVHIQTVSATTLVYDTVAHLTQKSLSSMT